MESVDSSDADSTQSPSYTLSWSGDSEDSDGISECSDFAQESVVVEPYLYEPEHSEDPSNESVSSNSQERLGNRDW